MQRLTEASVMIIPSVFNIAFICRFLNDFQAYLTLPNSSFSIRLVYVMKLRCSEQLEEKNPNQNRTFLFCHRE